MEKNVSGIVRPLGRFMVVAALLGLVSATRGEPAVACSLRTMAPILDGDLGDPAWRGVSSLALVGVAGTPRMTIGRTGLW